MIWALAMHLFPSITISGPFSIKTTIPTHPLAYSQLGLHSNASSSLLILGLRLFSAVRKLLQTLSLSTSKVYFSEQFSQQGAGNFSTLILQLDYSQSAKQLSSFVHFLFYF